MIFYLTIPKYTAFRATSVPLFVNRTALFEHAPKGPLPRAQGPWALDSGGYMALKAHGAWPIGHAQYVKEVRRAATEVGKLEWAASLDWMVEDEILAKTGKTVLEHQELTIESFMRLMVDAPDLRHLWLPVLQGETPEDYLRHFELYLIRGVDLRQVNRVGVGSVCRRWESTALRDIFSTLQRLGLHRLHGFGVKQTGFDWSAVMQRPTRPDVAALYQRAFERGLPYELLEEALRNDHEHGSTTWEESEAGVCHFLASADSAAWSTRARLHAEAVRSARRELAARRGFPPDAVRIEAGRLWFGQELVGEVLVNRAGERPRGQGPVEELPLFGAGVDDSTPALLPTQMLPACAARAAAWRAGQGVRPHEACNQCVPWALEYRRRLKERLAPQGCWEEASSLTTLPPVTWDVQRAHLEAAARAADLWDREGPEAFGSLEGAPEWVKRQARKRKKNHRREVT